MQSPGGSFHGGMALPPAPTQQQLAEMQVSHPEFLSRVATKSGNTDSPKSTCLTGVGGAWQVEQQHLQHLQHQQLAALQQQHYQRWWVQAQRQVWRPALPIPASNRAWCDLAAHVKWCSLTGRVLLGARSSSKVHGASALCYVARC